VCLSAVSLTIKSRSCIPQVSDNIFVRQESTKKLTMGHQAPLKSPLVEDNLLDGYRVTRSNNVVIIEKDEISDEVKLRKNVWQKKKLIGDTGFGVFVCGGLN